MIKSLPRTRRRSRSAIVAQPEAAPCNGLQNDDRRIAIEYVATDELRAPARALKRHSQQGLAALRASLQTHGFVRPIVVDGELKIVAGHGLWLAAKALDLADVPVVRVSHLTPEQLQAFAIADNQIANLNPWDDEALREALGELNDQSLKGLLEFNLEVTGFATSDIDRWLDVKIPPAAEAAEKEEELFPPADALAVTQSGDLWLLGQHKLLCGDAREAQSFARLLGDERAQLIWADGPYNVEIKGNVSGRGKVKHREFAMASGEMDRPQFTAFVGIIMGHCVTYSEDGSIHYQCMDWRHMREMLDAGHAHYSELMNLCVWTKPNAGMGSFYRSQHELIFVWKRGTAKHINLFGLGEGGRWRSNVWAYPGANGFHAHRDDELAMHSCVKNLSLVADAIRDCSHRGGIILDPYGGSGTTLIAAQKTGRRGRLIEIDPLYCDVIVRRWQKLTGEIAVLDGTGESFAEREAARLDASSDGEA